MKLVVGAFRFVLANAITLVLAAPAFGQFSITNASQLPLAMVGSSYNVQLIAIGGTDPVTFTLNPAGQAMPPGLSLSSAGTITGTPTTNSGAPFSLTVRATDSAVPSPSFINKTFTLNVIPALSLTDLTLPNGTVGVAYSKAVGVTGGIAPYVSWSASALPSPLTINSSGVISGTPTSAGTFNNIIVTVGDSSTPQLTASRTYSLTIGVPPNITTSSPLPQGTQAKVYSQTIAATGGTGALTFSLTPANTLPTGLTISTGGVLSGTPSVNGTFNFSLRVTDAASQFSDKSFLLTISPAPLITTSSLPSGSVGGVYSTSLQATGGLAPLTWSFAGSLPNGLTLDPTSGLLSGIPTTVANPTVTFTVTDANQATASANLSLNIHPALTITTASPLPVAAANTVYSQSFSATGGVGSSYLFTVAAGSPLPNGLTLTPQGLLSGSPTVAGSSTFTIQVADSANGIATKTFQLTIGTLVITTNSPLPYAVAGQPYAQTIGANGGSGSGYVFSIAPGSGLPDGLSLSSIGGLSGTPSSAGSSTFSLVVTDSAGNSFVKSFSLVRNQALTIMPVLALPFGNVGIPYSQALSASGGSGGGYQFVIASGNFPPGLSLSSNGLISGTPTPGNLPFYSFTVQVTDSNGLKATKEFVIGIGSAPTITTPNPLPTAVAGQFYSQTLTLTGGAFPYVWSVLPGSTLPDGLSLSTVGILSGVPSTTGTFGFTIQVTDLTPSTGSRFFNLTVASSALGISTSSLPTGNVNTAYSQALVATGGTPPYVWSIASGSLPPGLTLANGTGQITGTPTSASGTPFVFVGKVTDAANGTAEKQLSIAINAGPLSVTSSALPEVTAGVNYNFALSAAGGIAPYSWTLESGQLPSGISLSSGGSLSGNTSQLGTFPFVARVTDTNGATASAALSLVVAATASLSITTLSFANGLLGVVYPNSTLSASGGSGTGYTWNAVSGMPPGLTLSTAGVVGGTPTQAGTFTPLVGVADSQSNVATKQFSVTISTPGSSLRITTLALPGGTVGAGYAGGLQATGGDVPYTWSQSGLPEGLGLDPATGVTTGVPARADTFYTTITVRDSANRTASVTFTIVIQRSSSQLSKLSFVPLTPCRVMETRTEYNFQGRTGTFGPPSLNANETRTLTMPASNVCSIPAAARAFVLNVTLIPKSSVDFVTVYPGDETQPESWTVRSPDGQTVANSAIVRAGSGGTIKVFASGNADLLIDISGYFTDSSAVSNLVYYPLTPCRVIETRTDYRLAGPFGPPTMNTRETRRFRIPAAPSCSIPTNAAAYSATITVVPPQPLAYLTAWPAGAAQPNVSNINSFAGRVLANNVILPASADGSVDVFTFDRTDFLVDINGYFAPDDGVNGLYYYPLVTCRISDSNDAGFSGTFGGPIYGDETARTIQLLASPRCTSIPATAKAYALNFTALPNGSPMPFLTAYPTGQTRPNASVLNAFEGQVVSNSVILAAGTGGAIDVFAYRRTNVVVEAVGYFGR